ncbi:MAG TPA: hypothetical protein VKT22_11390 [Steroidobacteraceae bacterium]|nr:hypothetical protein [Steroidobacteraceae bacterium]
MKSFASIRLGSLGSISVQHSITSESDRPPGIAADAWIRLEDNLGVVVIPPPRGSASSGTPVASGYLMVKHNGYWVRLQLENAAPAVQLTPGTAT